ncbi:hypothetical protein [Haloglomus halophilum]|uniref:hypothetical protein n=1 Tax=Haloglomus halophilum TaxID=2962672 RepID=UPI0020C9AA07|nr:hypothetical protein [Haloglomus halophilum]
MAPNDTRKGDKGLSLERQNEDRAAELRTVPEEEQATDEEDSVSPRKIPTDTRPAIWPAGERPEEYSPEDRSDGETPDLYLPAEEKSKNQPEDDA